jgi:hypothetical protein
MLLSILWLTMSRKQAKVLSDVEVNRLLHFARRIRNPLRNHVIVLLSAKAGLRAGEIAALTRDIVLDPEGQVGSVIELRDSAAKKGSGALVTLVQTSSQVRQLANKCVFVIELTTPVCSVRLDLFSKSVTHQETGATRPL